MPIYEYECTICGRQTEVWQKFSDAPLEKCEACRGKMKKLVSQSSFHLKGTGWYVTDYASKSRSNQGKAPKCEAKTSSSDSKENSSSADTKDAKSGPEKKD